MRSYNPKTIEIWTWYASWITKMSWSGIIGVDFDLKNGFFFNSFAFMIPEYPLIVLLILGYLNLSWQYKLIKFSMLFIVNLWTNFKFEFIYFYYMKK